MANVLEIILSGNTKELDASLSKTEKRLNDFGKKMQSIGKDMSLYLTTPIVALGGASIKLASDFQESLNKVDVAFKESSYRVKEFAKTTIDSFGIAEGTALDMAALFGDMATSMGINTVEASKLSTSLVGLAGDLASFKNMNIEEVTTALNGVFTGETESLKRLGIVMTEVNLKQFALEQGMNANLQTMSQSEKVMLRYQYVMSKTSNAQGDFARTGRGAANQTRMFKENLKELGASLGQEILPLFTDIVSGLNDVLKGFRKLDSGTKKLIIALTGFVALSGPLLYMAGTILPKLAVGMKLLTTEITLLGTSVKALPLASLIALLGIAGKSAYDMSKNMGADTGLTADMIANDEAIQNTIDSLKEQIKVAESYNKTLDNSHKVTTGFNTAQTTLNGSYGKSVDELKNSLKYVMDLQYRKKLMANSEQVEAERLANLNNIVKKNSEEVVVNIDALKRRRDELEKTADIIREQVKAEQELAKAKYEMLTTPLQAPKTADITQPKSGINAEQVVTNQIVKALEDRKKAMKDAYDNILPIANGIQGVFNQMGEGIIQSLNITGTAFGNFISGMASFLIEYAGMAIKQLLIDKAVATSTATTGAVKTASASGPAFAVVLPAILAGVLGVVGSAFKKIPKFADGGIVSGPTMAMVGEYSGAKRNPEVIAPLDRLQSMIGGGGGNVNVSGEFVVRGQDLVLALQNANQFKNRIS